MCMYKMLCILPLCPFILYYSPYKITVMLECITMNRDQCRDVKYDTLPQNSIQWKCEIIYHLQKLMNHTVITQGHDCQKKPKQTMILCTCTGKWILYNYCTSLCAIWCVMEHWKAIYIKVKGHSQYCFSVLHNTSYYTKWSAVIVLLHLTFPDFICVSGPISKNCLLFFFKFKKHMSWSI